MTDFMISWTRSGLRSPVAFEASYLATVPTLDRIHSSSAISFPLQTISHRLLFFSKRINEPSAMPSILYFAALPCPGGSAVPNLSMYMQVSYATS